MEIILSETQAASLLKAIDEYDAKLRHDAQVAENQEQRQLYAEIEGDLEQVRDELCDELLYQIRSARYHPTVQ